MSRAEYIDRNMEDLFRVSFRNTCIVGAVIVMLTTFMDYIAAPEHFSATLSYRIVVSLVLIAINIVAARVKSFAWLKFLAYVAIASAAISAEMLILTLHDHQPQYYVGMILLAIGAATLITARPSFHAGSLIIIYLIYVIPAIFIFRLVPMEDLIVANTFIIACFSAAFVSGYFRFKQMVKSYGLQYDLDLDRRRSERRLSENLPGIVYRLHPEGDRRIQFFNDMLERITGYTENELGKKSVCCIETLIAPDDQEEVVALVQDAISEVKPFEVEYRIVHKDGSPRHCLERGRPIVGEDGKVLYVDGIILDNTDRKQAEDTLKSSEELYRTLVENSPN